MKILPPRSGVELWILEKGREKYGWRWVKCESGDWFGAKEHTNCILQVRDLPPRYPTQQWRRCMGGDYIGTEEWRALDSFIAIE